jgi:single-strand DNA-binding protein
MNTVNLIGRLTADPELTAPKGNPVCRYRIAVDRLGTDAGADFVTIVSFGSRGENDAKYLSKGRLVAITGRLHQNTWTDPEGNNRERVEVIASVTNFLDKPRSE